MACHLLLFGATTQFIAIDRHQEVASLGAFQPPWVIAPVSLNTLASSGTPKVHEGFSTRDSWTRQPLASIQVDNSGEFWRPMLPENQPRKYSWHSLMHIMNQCHGREPCLETGRGHT